MESEKKGIFTTIGNYRILFDIVGDEIQIGSVLQTYLNRNKAIQPTRYPLSAGL